jgi:hypothetical protein
MAADDGLDRQRPNTSWTARDVELADMSKFSRRSGKHSLITDGLVSSADRQARRDPAAIRARSEGSAALAGGVDRLQAESREVTRREVKHQRRLAGYCRVWAV